MYPDSDSQIGAGTHLQLEHFDTFMPFDGSELRDGNVDYTPVETRLRTQIVEAISRALDKEVAVNLSHADTFTWQVKSGDEFDGMLCEQGIVGYGAARIGNKRASVAVAVMINELDFYSTEKVAIWPFDAQLADAEPFFLQVVTDRDGTRVAPQAQIPALREFVDSLR
jgi:hypothetical protein